MWFVGCVITAVFMILTQAIHAVLFGEPKLCKPKAPRCPDCGRQLRPVELIQLWSDGSRGLEREADWFCPYRYFGHNALHFTSKPSTSKPVADGIDEDFGGLRMVG